MVLEAAGEFILPYINANIINNGAAIGDISYIIRNGIYMLLIAIGMMAAGVLGANFGIRGASRLAAGVREDTFRQIQKFSFSNIDDFSTGAGKTTVTNLLSRFYDVESGSITIDGIPIEKINRHFLRQNIAMVLQATHLFTGTVRENIRYGRLDATDEEVEAAAKIASAHSFIMNLEKGYDTILEHDGANLSQGQRQLLNIARAAISKAPILILDETTSSVDTRTERHIEKGMDALMKNRTTFVIAQLD